MQAKGSIPAPWSNLSPPVTPIVYFLFVLLLRFFFLSSLLFSSFSSFPHPMHLSFSFFLELIFHQRLLPAIHRVELLLGTVAQLGLYFSVLVSVWLLLTNTMRAEEVQVTSGPRWLRSRRPLHAICSCLCRIQHSIHGHERWSHKMKGAWVPETPPRWQPLPL